MIHIGYAQVTDSAKELEKAENSLQLGVQLFWNLYIEQCAHTVPYDSKTRVETLFCSKQIR